MHPPFFREERLGNRSGTGMRASAEDLIVLSPVEPLFEQASADLGGLRAQAHLVMENPRESGGFL
jgi:hypothetical protein